MLGPGSGGDELEEVRRTRITGAAPVEHRSFCPHCRGDLGTHWSRAHAARCPHCRLVVGAGRAITDRRQAGAGTAGSAAGAVANAARRSDAEPGDPQEIILALHAVAERAGVAIDRLRLLDYAAACGEDEDLPTLEVVMATFHGWKQARAAAARETVAPR